MARSLLLRVATTAVALCAFLACGGCLQTEGKATIEKDGSGRIARTFVLDEKAMTEITALMNSMGPGAPAGEDPAAGEQEYVIDPAKIAETIKARAAKVPGVKIEKFDIKEDKKAERLTIQLEAAFSDIESLGKSGLLLNEAIEVKKNADGSYTLEMDPIAGNAAQLTADGANANPMVQQGLPLIEPYLETLEVKQTTVFPGTLVETNGKKSDDGKSVSWAATWKDVKAGKVVRSLTFKGEGVEIKPAKYRPDPMALYRLFAPEAKKPAAPGEKPAGDKPAPEKPAGDKPAGEKPGEKPPEKPPEKGADAPK